MDIATLNSTFHSRSVLVTGHTGFKGSWLCEWLLGMGARVSGVALEPTTTPALFDELALAQRLDHHVLDVRDRRALARIIADVRPAFVFHLAAQPLVRESYEIPVETFETNVMGTANLLDGLRTLDADHACSVVVVTSDKCYENRDWLYGYRESDPLGGHDPYSASKACQEIVAAAWRQSFFHGASALALATARAGNVVGGGDWARDRLVPDCVRHLQRGKPIPVRNPRSTRPWQHVLEPLFGYLLLAAHLDTGNGDDRYETAFNFGPDIASNRSVASVVDAVLSHWPGTREDLSEDAPLHEAGKLALAWEKAFHVLGWQPRWDFDTTIARTVEWYRQRAEGVSPAELVAADIEAYCATETR